MFSRLVSAKCYTGTSGLIFNNMGVLSRASWFQDEFDGVIVMTTPEKQKLEYKIVCQRTR